MNSFMSGIKSAAAGAITGDDDKKRDKDQTLNQDQPSNSDLVSSAKLVAEAAQCAASNKSDQIDKPKVAGAAADLVEAAEKYGKFDETQGAGKYLKQADEYLHKYEKSGATAAPPAAAVDGDAPPAKEEKKEEEGSGFGAADALKAAGSFFK